MSLSDKAQQKLQEEMVQQPPISLLPPPPSDEVVPTDVGIAAHQAAVTHLEECMNALDWDPEDSDGEPEPEVATMAPFCGCTDCVVREVLFVAYPILTGKTYDEPVGEH